MGSSSGRAPKDAADVCLVSGKARMGRGEAIRAAKRTARGSGENLAAYHCNRCDGWHIGHDFQDKSKEVYRRRRKKNAYG